jgi:hypothetical protein
MSTSFGCCIVDMSTGEVILECNEEITEEKLDSVG